MLGAIIGDTVGSVYEFNNTKEYDFTLFHERSNYTDDSLMSLAVAKWLVEDPSHSHSVLEKVMVEVATDYPCPVGGYGGGFRRWLFAPQTLRDYEDGEASSGRRPYNSWGNGSAMRVSAVGWMFATLEETEKVAELSASITHNHPEGIKGAQATAAAIFLARTGSTKAQIREYIVNRFGYDLSPSWDAIHLTYGWEDSCQGTVPPAIISFLASSDFEDAIRRAVALGGDSDTLACITGGIAEAFYKDIPQQMIDETMGRLTAQLRRILDTFASASGYDQLYQSYVKPKAPKRYTPENIRYLKENEIFVFGSNLDGLHGGGAARVAQMSFGAVWGQGVGLQGRSYAIPTMQGGVETIRPYVDDFIGFAQEHPELTFYVTRIGCGIAGFRDEEIAPLFMAAADMENVVLPRTFQKVIDECKESAPVLDGYNLVRFHEAQRQAYQIALDEIRHGCKMSHWMWYIFPQVKGLGSSSTSEFYGITGEDEARAYLDDRVLGERLREISVELLNHSSKTIESILGGIDSMKLKSSMTLFDYVSPEDVFGQVLDVFFSGKRDALTLEIINLPF